jgi:hypothetical protein
MSTFLNFLGTIVKTGAVVGLVTFATAGGFAYATKPDERMLRSTIGKEMTGQSEESIPIVGSFLADVVSAGATLEMKDFVLFRTAKVTDPSGGSQMYIGSFQHWVAPENLHL